MPDVSALEASAPEVSTPEVSVDDGPSGVNSRQGLNLLVFREGRKPSVARELRAALQQKILSLLPGPPPFPSPDTIVAALLLAGEMECAVNDNGDSGDAGAQDSLPQGSEAEAPFFPDITDCLAALLLDPSDLQSLRRFSRQMPLLERVVLPETLFRSAPEGFAYYALHPLVFAKVIEKFEPLPARLAVVGIRSIGTTLSAMAAAAARKKGVHAARITVRPVGHPYDRCTNFCPRQFDFVRAHMSADADFLVVDEGPGLSGSSFLSVAEALQRAGVGSGRIILAGSHEPSVDSLCAPDASRRWRKYRWIVADSAPRKPAEAEEWLGGGVWRRFSFPDSRNWPASWKNFERLKYRTPPLSPKARLFKFVGLGHYGSAVFNREQQVAAEGFGPEPRIETDGFVSYPWFSYPLVSHPCTSYARTCGAASSAPVYGNAGNIRPISDSILSRLASYCSFRMRSFAQNSADFAPLQEMAEHNLAQFQLGQQVHLHLERPVLADARMNPHEWLFTPNGLLLKTDSGSHGDDHFYPGVTDIAWDLAGAIVEWKMNAAHAERFLELYRRSSGDDPRRRINMFLIAYLAFRRAYCTMAARALSGTEEPARFIVAAEDYRKMLTRLAQNRHKKAQR